MSRGWTWIDEESVTEEKQEELTPLLNELARIWSILSHEAEQKQFIRQMDEEGDRDFDYEENEDEKVFHIVQMRLQSARIDAIENMLAEHGARMMRPYEHWNEDERYMEYQESRYDY